MTEADDEANVDELVRITKIAEVVLGSSLPGPNGEARNEAPIVPAAERSNNVGTRPVALT